MPPSRSSPLILYRVMAHWKNLRTKKTLTEFGWNFTSVITIKSNYACRLRFPRRCFLLFYGVIALWTFLKNTQSAQDLLNPWPDSYWTLAIKICLPKKYRLFWPMVSSTNLGRLGDHEITPINLVLVGQRSRSQWHLVVRTFLFIYSFYFPFMSPLTETLTGLA